MKIIKNILALHLVFLMACDSGTSIAPESAESFCLDDIFRAKIEINTVQKEQINEGIHLTGAVESNPDKVVHFVSLVSGIISKTYFSLGDEVQKGQVLAELRSTELSGMQSELSGVSSQIQVAQKNLESVEAMFKDGISSERELLAAQSEVDILKSERQKVQNNLNFFSASSEKGVFQIKAPVSGIITSKTIAAGTQIASDGQSMFTISDLSEVWVMANIYATNVRQIKEGMKVNIETLSYPDTVFKGEIGSISSVLDSEAKVLKARITLENKDFKLKPGMLVDITALKNLEEKAIAIPTEALVFDDNKNYVVVYKDDCDLRKQEVEILSSSNGTTYIQSGISENDQIITKNHLLVFEQIK